MVLSRRGGENPTSIETLIFDGSGDVNEFIFIFENVIAINLSEEDKSEKKFSHLRGGAFESYF